MVQTAASEQEKERAVDTREGFVSMAARLGRMARETPAARGVYGVSRWRRVRGSGPTRRYRNGAIGGFETFERLFGNNPGNTKTGRAAGDATAVDGWAPLGNGNLSIWRGRLGFRMGSVSGGGIAIIGSRVGRKGWRPLEKLD
ncbi:hypothetical protein CPLU01_05752 [Colletotrichum plurivorum]|uniref:Uncharacterized protein n=1 Tax=Colletotrichum plurivorum TaxID=2175906 RepID=A0A8H6NHH3_9PEZI|nr:hypothetical protein CPLU01_05752 [Colletotrichum plurivorum]